jgi:hypothetical protein
MHRFAAGLQGLARRLPIDEHFLRAAPIVTSDAKCARGDFARRLESRAGRATCEVASDDAFSGAAVIRHVVMANTRARATEDSQPA